MRGLRFFTWNWRRRRGRRRGQRGFPRCRRHFHRRPGFWRYGCRRRGRRLLLLASGLDRRLPSRPGRSLQRLRFWRCSRGRRGRFGDHLSLFLRSGRLRFCFHGRRYALRPLNGGGLVGSLHPAGSDRPGLRRGGFGRRLFRAVRLDRCGFRWCWNGLLCARRWRWRSGFGRYASRFGRLWRRARRLASGSLGIPVALDYALQPRPVLFQRARLFLRLDRRRRQRLFDPCRRRRRGRRTRFGRRGQHRRNRRRQRQLERQPAHHAADRQISVRRDQQRGHRSGRGLGRGGQGRGDRLEPGAGAEEHRHAGVRLHPAVDPAAQTASSGCAHRSARFIQSTRPGECLTDRHFADR